LRHGRAQHSGYPGSSGGIVSSFRLICIAALTAAMVVFVADAAAAQSATAADQSGKPYLAGLRPPHEQHKTAHTKTSHVSEHHKASTKLAQPATKRRPMVTAHSKTHRPARLADKINSRVTWPSVEPAAADERTTPETVLRFTTEDTEQAPVAASHPAPPASVTSAAKTAPPAKIAATEERNNAGSAAVENPPTASTLVQTESYQAPDRTDTLAAAAPQQETAHASGHSMTAQLLVTLAGAISAGIVGWLMIGFGSVRTFKSS
jgi:hypothetical protein